MARYIDLDKCSQYKTNHGGYPDTFAFPPWTEFEDVAPVTHAHWIYQGLSRPYNCFSRCSCCGVVFDGYETFEYCPKCGAKMDEEVE